MDRQAAQWIKKLKLERHPEGGYFRETYRSEVMIGERSAATTIYYMLTTGEFSAFHRLKSDEVWHHYAGGSLTLHMIDDGKLTQVKLGKGSRESPQVLVRANTWFAGSPNGKYCLVGCTMSPGFYYQDWELGKKDELVRAYPQHKAVINRYATV
jgi:predicted cupin superfamily sugar epimerase